jgi:hypothetical protein
MVIGEGMVVAAAGNCGCDDRQMQQVKLYIWGNPLRPHE